MLKRTSACMAVAAIAVLAAAQTARADLIHHYAFDEASGTTATDSGSSPSNGTLVNGTVVGATGKIGTAYTFDGTNDYVNSNAAIAPTSGDYSMFVWANSTSVLPVNAQKQLLSNNNSQVGRANLGIVNKTGVPSGAFWFHNGATPGEIDDTTTITNGAWHLIGITHIGTTTKLYVDGASMVSGIDTALTSTTWYIGGPRNTSLAAAQSWGGQIDDVSVWNSGLTATQVLSMVNLANDTLNYGAGDAEVLFDVFAAGVSGSPLATSDGNQWQYMTGLSGTNGQVLNNNTLILDATAGTGVQIVPEPGTLALLTTGLLGLLAYAWRKRKS